MKSFYSFYEGTKRVIINKRKIEEGHELAAKQIKKRSPQTLLIKIPRRKTINK